jgi:KDO2-lipid IV(A) lauroyltransferase
MISRMINSLWQHLRYVPLLSALSVSRGRAFDRRSKALGRLVGAVLRYFPPARERCDREILRVFPNMPQAARRTLCRNMGRNMGRTLFEIYHGAEFRDLTGRHTVMGPGLAELEAARDAGHGAIIVSGHFGQWEAVRSVLYARGMETGAVYRQQTNRHYERRLLAGIEAGGLPIVPTGQMGTRALVRHIRNGGFIAILLDEKYPDGVRIPFLGRPALTSVAAAQLALKYGLPMVPAYGTRTGDGSTFDVEFEAPIAHTDAETMTRAFNDSLSARVLATPGQWYWMLRRWNGAEDEV